MIKTTIILLMLTISATASPLRDIVPYHENWLNEVPVDQSIIATGVGGNLTEAIANALHELSNAIKVEISTQTKQYEIDGLKHFEKLSKHVTSNIIGNIKIDGITTTIQDDSIEGPQFGEITFKIIFSVDSKEAILKNHRSNETSLFESSFRNCSIEDILVEIKNYNIATEISFDSKRYYIKFIVDQDWTYQKSNILYEIKKKVEIYKEYKEYKEFEKKFDEYKKSKEDKGNEPEH